MRRFTASSIAESLTVAAAIAFLPLFFWKSRLLLMFASGLIWLSMTFLGLIALFGSKSTVTEIMFKAARPELSEIDKEAYGRFFGAILSAFMIFAVYEIFHSGLAAAYNNFGR
jgi:hypothetical protein